MPLFTPRQTSSFGTVGKPKDFLKVHNLISLYINCKVQAAKVNGKHILSSTRMCSLDTSNLKLITDFFLLVSIPILIITDNILTILGCLGLRFIAWNKKAYLCSWQEDLYKHG